MAKSVKERIEDLNETFIAGDTECHNIFYSIEQKGLGLYYQFVDSKEIFLEVDLEGFLSKLRAIDPNIPIEGIRIDSGGDKDLQNIAQFTGLKKLEIFDEEVSYEGFATLEKFAALEDLTLLGASHNFTNKSLSHLDGVKGTLKKLKFWKVKIDDAAVPALAQFTNLEYLQISHANLTDDGLIALLPKLTNLKELHLDESAITKKSAPYIYALAKEGKLQRFISGNLGEWATPIILHTIANENSNNEMKARADKAAADLNLPVPDIHKGEVAQANVAVQQK